LNDIPLNQIAFIGDRFAAFAIALYRATNEQTGEKIITIATIFD
jgi:hypothetical protein